MTPEGLDEKAVASTGMDVYVPSFTQIKKALGLPDDALKREKIIIPTKLFKFLMSSWLLREHFDEAAYRKNNPDVDVSIRAGKLASAKSHYVLNGYYEGRTPGSYAVDINWYRTQYPDIALAERKMQGDPKYHFNVRGRTEGRAGSAGQMLQQHAWRNCIGV